MKKRILSLALTLCLLAGLLPGSYTLTETQAPGGYQKLSQPISFRVGADGTITLADGTITDAIVANDGILQVRNRHEDLTLTLKKELVNSQSTQAFRFTVSYEINGQTVTETLGPAGGAAIKEATVSIGVTELKRAVVNGLANARKLLKKIDEGEAFYHLIEVMTCQGGCVGGAGQPYGLKATKEKRGDGLHQSDNAAMFKRAERNPIVVRMMAEYGEERCHELLHVSYRGE